MTNLNASIVKGNVMKTLIAKDKELTKAVFAFAAEYPDSINEIGKACNEIAISKKRDVRLVNDRIEFNSLMNPALMWLAWGVGNSFARILGEEPPEWAVKLRSQWDDCW